MTGKIKWFNNKQGYGFITNDNGVDYFVHYSDIISNERYKKLHKGEQVSFSETNEHGKLKAINVTKIV